MKKMFGVIILLILFNVITYYFVKIAGVKSTLLAYGITIAITGSLVAGLKLLLD